MPVAETIAYRSNRTRISVFMIHRVIIHRLDDLFLPVYIFCRPDIPDDHLLRITKDRIIEVVKNQQHYPKYKDQIPDFENMFCEIAGWCRVDELEKVSSIPGQEFTGIRYVKQSGKLHKNRASWQKLISLI